jgi:hypothetical protein
MNVNEKLSLVSRVFDLKSLLFETTMCGMSFDPGYGRAGLHGDALRRENELVDLNLQIHGLRRGDGNNGSHCKHDGHKRDRDTDVGCEFCHDPDLPPQP